MAKSSIKTYFTYTTKYHGIASILTQSAELAGGELELRPTEIREEIGDYIKLSTRHSVSLTKTHSALSAKLKLSSIITAIKENMGEEIIYCDADVVFLSPILQHIPREPWDICAPSYLPIRTESLDWGFLIINCEPQVLNFFSYALEESERNPSTPLPIILGSACSIIRAITLPKHFANFTNRGMKDAGEVAMYHYNKPRGNPNAVLASLARERQLLKNYTTFDSSDGRLSGDTKEERTSRLERLEKESLEGEGSIEDFISNGCIGPKGTPLNVDCNKIWADYQAELHKPGCKSCIKRKIVKKYLDKVKRLINEEHGI